MRRHRIRGSRTTMRRLAFSLGIMLLLAAAPARAQQPPQPPPENPTPQENVPGITVRPNVGPAEGRVTDGPALDGLELGDFESPSELLGQGGPFSDNTGVLRSGGRSLFETPRAASITPRDVLDTKQASDLVQALQNEVGVLMQSTAAGQASPFVRGLTGQQVLILIDGIRLNNSIFRFGPNQYFNTIDPGMVDHIEVLRGAGSTQWGSDAIGGVINVVTRAPSIHDPTCEGYRGLGLTQYFNTANSAPYSRLQVEGWRGSTGMLAGGSFLNVRDLDTGGVGRQPGTNYQQYSGDVKVNYLLDENQLLTLAMQHVELENVPRSDRFPGYPGDRNNSNTPGNARFFDPQQRDLIYLRYQALEPFPWSDALTVTASYHRQRDVQTRGIPTTRFQETDVDTVGVSVVSSKQLDAGLGRVMGGVDWYHDDVDSRFGGTASGPIIPDDAWYERFGIFLGWEAPLTDRLDAVAGVRFEHIDLAATPEISNTPVFISPHYEDWVANVGLTYALTPSVRLVGSISEGFRAPNLDELTGNNPNVLQQGQDLPSLGLIPERALSYELGVKTDFEGLKTQTFVFWTDLNNNIVPISAGSNQFRRANQDSYVQGVEMDGVLQVTCDWSVYGNFWYTYGRNRVTGGPLSRIPPTQGTLGVQYRRPEHQQYFQFFAWMVRKQDRLDPVRDVSDERIPIGGTPGYATLNLRAGRTYGACDEHRLSLSLENLTDENYLVHGSGVFGTGITARFGYSWIY